MITGIGFAFAVLVDRETVFLVPQDFEAIRAGVLVLRATTRITLGTGWATGRALGAGRAVTGRAFGTERLKTVGRDGVGVLLAGALDLVVSVAADIFGRTLGFALTLVMFAVRETPVSRRTRIVGPNFTDGRLFSNYE